MRRSLSYAVIWLNLFSSIANDRCCRANDRRWPIYRSSKLGKRSTIAIVARERVSNLENCEKFAVSKRALAFNYRRPRARNNNRRRNRSSEANCQALECPEINGYSELANNTRFSYHSIYKPRITSANVTLTCLPRVGIFHISKDQLNYTNAQSACKKLGGNLARIVTEERTEGLGKFVNDVPTFVGLSNRDKERVWKTELDEPLSCFDYRGWAVNEPAHLRGCVALSGSPKPHSSSSWRVVPCSRKFPYICEIPPRLASKSQRKNRKD